METKEIKSKFKKYPEYRDSGVEWIGMIPEHWEVKKLKFLGSIYAGLTGKNGGDFFKEEKINLKKFIPFINICNNMVIYNQQMQYVSVSENENQNIVKKNDILFLMSSETFEDIGKCSLYLGNKEVFLNSFCKGFRISNKKIYPVYINFLLNSNIFRDYFAITARGFTRINVKQEYINNAFVLIPPISEQTAIASFLDNKTKEIDQTISNQRTLITKLKEYKQTLIDSAVTGKIKII